jgi:YVTN family beta-propeller protein
MWRRAAWLLLLGFAVNALAADAVRVGDDIDGARVVPTRQLIRPAGRSVEFNGRPVDLALSPDGASVYVKDNRGLVVLDTATWTVRQELAFPTGGGSMHGIAISRDGNRLYLTTAQNALHEATRRTDGSWEWSRAISLPGPGGEGNSHGCGVALSAEDGTAYVCLSRNNALGVVDLKEGKLVREIPVGVAPFDVALSRDGSTAYVSNWGGRRPKAGEKTAKSSGTDTLVDERGVASSGSVSFVNLASGAETAQVETGLHPSDIALSSDGRMLAVANANSDSVTLIETASATVVATILVRPDPTLPFGSATNAVAFGEDGNTLYAANAGNNAVAVIDLARRSALGYVPTGWYPGGVATDGRNLYVVNVKGLGSRARKEEGKGWHVYWYLGTANAIAIPSSETLATYTTQVLNDARVPQMLRSREKADVDVPPVPVPAHIGEPSVFEHVIYIIKENRTYDQLFGDLTQGNGNPTLCIFGRDVTPNHHALAEQFVLLDNFYCNGVLSADGHSWATEGNVTDHLEKSFGGFTRSYTFGDDPLTYSSSGFIWDNVLLKGLSFRNYGEMDYAETEPTDATFSQIWKDYLDGTGAIRFTQNIGIETLRRYSCPDYPGWNLRIPDVLRADRFLKEFAEFERRGDFPNFVIVYLPNDHTTGTSPDAPTPQAQVADNDLALGRIVEAVTQSRFWERTCIFVVEDDPQAGFDHVDGHRSIGLVVSPYTKRRAVVSDFYNQTSVLHTIARILGVPPMNQMDSQSPLMTTCFTDSPDLTPYTALPSRVRLDELNPKTSALDGAALYWAQKSLAEPFERFDQADEDVLNRILWHAVKGVDTPYPSEYAGAHGKGLDALRLVFSDDDDDD